jgi:hypothetical protein
MLMVSTYCCIPKQNKNTKGGLPEKEKLASYEFQNLNRLLILLLFNDAVSTTDSTLSNETGKWALSCNSDVAYLNS